MQGDWVSVAAYRGSDWQPGTRVSFDWSTPNGRMVFDTTAGARALPVTPAGPGRFRRSDGGEAPPFWVLWVDEGYQHRSCRHTRRRFRFRAEPRCHDPCRPAGSGAASPRFQRLRFDSTTGVEMTRMAAIIGGGVIGGGWAARFLLNGWDVMLYDPDPEAERKMAEVLANARHALPMLYDTAMPAEGTLRHVKTIAEAVGRRGLHSGKRARAARPETQGSRPRSRPHAKRRHGDRIVHLGLQTRPSCRRVPGIPGRILVDPSVQPGLPAAADRGCPVARRQRPQSTATESDAAVHRAASPCTSAGRDRRPYRRPLPRSGLARGAVADQGRHRHHRGNRRGDPLWALACAGRRWACSRPTASPGARPECGISSNSSALACNGPGPS